jgi:hypothetical protein
MQFCMVNFGTWVNTRDLHYSLHSNKLILRFFLLSAHRHLREEPSLGQWFECLKSKQKRTACDGGRLWSDVRDLGLYLVQHE